mgnify:CR=1 FL=1
MDKKENGNMTFNHIAQILKQGEKYTAVSFTEFGYPFSVQFRLVNAVVEPYAQYDEVLKLIIKKKGAKKYDSLLMCCPYQKLIIWEGWVNPDVDMWKGRVEVKEDVIIREALFAFDPRYLKYAIESVDKDPIIIYGYKYKN